MNGKRLRDDQYANAAGIEGANLRFAAPIFRPSFRRDCRHDGVDERIVLDLLELAAGQEIAHRIDSRLKVRLGTLRSRENNRLARESPDEVQPSQCDFEGLFQRQAVKLLVDLVFPTDTGVLQVLPLDDDWDLQFAMDSSGQLLDGLSLQLPTHGPLHVCQQCLLELNAIRRRRYSRIFLFRSNDSSVTGFLK